MPMQFEDERRRSPRTAEPGHVWWGTPDEDWRNHGWITDRSVRGLAIITRYARRLKPGDRIDVSEMMEWQGEGLAPADHYQVCRVEPYDEELSVVACQIARA